jgi:hypothetical protein
MALLPFSRDMRFADIQCKIYASRAGFKNHCNSNRLAEPATGVFGKCVNITDSGNASGSAVFH